MDHEDAFKSFVIREKQGRYAHGLRSPKHRKKLLDRLNHNHDFDPSFLLRLAKEMQSASAVYALLKSAGAPDECYVFSANPSIDGMRMPLAEALSKTFAMGLGTVISCIPGKLAYFEGEDPGECYVLRRP